MACHGGQHSAAQHAPPCCCRCGDRVVVTSRSQEGAERAAEQLREEVGPAADVKGGPEGACLLARPALL